MSSNSISALQIPKLLRDGVAVGIAGGLAEVLVVALYCVAAGASAPDVARHIASAVGLDGASAWTGLTIHLALAAMLGVALVFAWDLTNGYSPRAASPYASMMLTLAGVWAINFFIVLPVLSPGFVTLLPLSVTLFSKLLFGLAAAVVLRALSGEKRQSARAGFMCPAPRVATT